MGDDKTPDEVEALEIVKAQMLQAIEKRMRREGRTFIGPLSVAPAELEVSEIVRAQTRKTLHEIGEGQFADQDEIPIEDCQRILKKVILRIATKPHDWHFEYSIRDLEELWSTQFEDTAWLEQLSELRSQYGFPEAPARYKSAALLLAALVTVLFAPSGWLGVGLRGGSLCRLLRCDSKVGVRLVCQRFLGHVC